MRSFTLSLVLLCAFAWPVVAAPPEPDPFPCKQGNLACVDKVIREMDRRFQPLARACDHNAVFSLIYLRTTEVFRRAAGDPHFFQDTPYVIREDVLFGDYYFDAYDAWRDGHTANVPPAWRVAFAAADDGAVSGAGNLLLGMNAHINRDLAFVLDDLGLVAPDGSSRKADHDRVNDFLRDVLEPGLAEIARRFDPSVDDAMIDGTTLDEEALFQIVVSWREGAWRNAERLAAARTPAARAQVAQEIEAGAEATAQLLREQTAYRPPLTTRAARDAWCADHWDDEDAGGVQGGGKGKKNKQQQAESAGDGGVLLSPAYPNPFNPSTVFTLAVNHTEPVRVEVVDMLGRRVALLHDGPLAPGTAHRFSFDAAALPGGAYLVRAMSPSFAESRLVTLLK